MSDQTDQQVPGAPSDNTTLAAILGELSAGGWTGDLRPVAGGKVQCCACSEAVPAGELQIDQQRRVEGASDPDDMQLVVAATCPGCGAKGVLVLGYGPNASELDGDVVVALPR